MTTEAVDGKVEATVDDEIFETLVSSTVESALEAETRPEVVITVETSNDTVADTVEVTLSTNSVEALAQTETGVLTVESEVGAITFDNQALTAITKENAENYTISISKVDGSSLNEKQTAVVGDRPVYDFSVVSDNGYVSNFDGGYATVKLPYTLEKGENPNCLFVYYVDSNGNINKMQTMYDAQNQMIVFNTSHFSVFTVVHELLNLIFDDVQENDWFFDYVSFAYQNDLFGGTSKTTFAPDTAMSRGMLVQTLNSYEGNPEASLEAQYPDVESNQWFASAVDWATERNIVSGMKNGKFSPDEAVTREQLALILFNYAKDKGYDVSDSVSLSSFPDADSVSSWAEEAMTWAVVNELILGIKGKLSPETNATRAQVAVILKNFIENVVQ